MEDVKPSISMINQEQDSKDSEETKESDPITNIEQAKQSISVQHQRIFLKFCVLLDYSANNSKNLLHKALGQNSLKATAIKNWIKSFKEGRLETEDLPKPGLQKSQSRKQARDRILEVLALSRKVSVRDISTQLDLSQTTVFRVLSEDLGLVSKFGGWVPHKLTESEKEYRCEIARLNLSRYKRRNDLLNRIICVDELYIPLQKYKSLIEPGTSIEPITRPKINEPKILLIVGIDIRGVSFWKTYDEDIILDSERYKLFLQEYVPRWSWEHHVSVPVLLHDNTPLHKAKIVQEYISSQGWIELRHPSNSPDMNPCDYNCFGHLKHKLTSRRYNTKAELDTIIGDAFHEFKQIRSFNGVSELPQIWERIVEKEGNY